MSGNRLEDISPTETRTLDQLLDQVASGLQNRSPFGIGFSPPVSPIPVSPIPVSSSTWYDYSSGGHQYESHYQQVHNVYSASSYNQWDFQPPQSKQPECNQSFHYIEQAHRNADFVQVENTEIPTSAAILNSVVGNWSPNVTGSYSPFGTENLKSDSVSYRPQVTTKPPMAQSKQAVPQPKVVQGTTQEKLSQKPSYSDILSRSPPMTNSESNHPTNPIKTTRPAVSKSKSFTKDPITRQHSFNSDNRNMTAARRDSLDSQQKSDSPTWGSLSELDAEYRNKKNTSVKEVKGNRVTRILDFQSVGQKSSFYDDTCGSVNDEDNEVWETVAEQSFKFRNIGSTKLEFLNNDVMKQIHSTQKSTSYINNLKSSHNSEKNVASHATKGLVFKKDATSKLDNKGSNNNNVPRSKGSSVNCTPSNALRTEKVNKEPMLRKGRSKRKDGETFVLVSVCQLAGLYCKHWSFVIMSAVIWFAHLIYDVVTMSSRLVRSICVQSSGWITCHSILTFNNIWSGIKCQFAYFHKKLTKKKEKPVIVTGLEYNMPLPTTGDEALKRLLSCKGKDPYSILGVTPTCTDDDIKKYYKRQAFLVHPDKNHQPGAEEAFKILAKAFDIIGEPEVRRYYDEEMAKTQRMEQTLDHLNDMLGQLHKKMEEVANTIRCTNCSKRHRRIRTERPLYAARFCGQCKIHHAAREGDVWAESSMLGFLWHYYACMEGAVYDITEWASCQVHNLKHLKTNGHIVQYRIVQGKKAGNTGSQHNRYQYNGASPQFRSEADLKDLLNNLYNNGRNTGGNNAANYPCRNDTTRRSKGKKKK